MHVELKVSELRRKLRSLYIVSLLPINLKTETKPIKLLLTYTDVQSMLNWYNVIQCINNASCTFIHSKSIHKQRLIHEVADDKETDCKQQWHTRHVHATSASDPEGAGRAACLVPANRVARLLVFFRKPVLDVRENNKNRIN